MRDDRHRIRDVLGDRDLTGAVMVRAFVEKALAQASLLTADALTALAHDFRTHRGWAEVADKPLLEAWAKHLEAMAREKR